MRLGAEARTRNTSLPCPPPSLPPWLPRALAARDTRADMDRGPWTHRALTLQMLE